MIASPNWKLRFSKAEVIHHVACFSDHSPVELNLFYNVAQGPKPFRFIEAWTQDARCKSIIQDTWDDVFGASLGSRFYQRLQRTISSLTKWNKDILGNCQTCIYKLK